MFALCKFVHICGQNSSLKYYHTVESMTDSPNFIKRQQTKSLVRLVGTKGSRGKASWSSDQRLGLINCYEGVCGSVDETYLVCAWGHTVRPGATVCVHACTSRHYMICSAVTLSHRCLVFRLHLRCRPCQLKTQRIALCRADTFTCSQCCTFAPAGLAVTLLADDGAHRIPWSRPELLFSAAGVWLEGRVF